MEFALVGGMMLAVVLMFYIRMINQHDKVRRKQDQVSHWLDKIAVLESVAKDESALQMVDSALKEYPNNERLLYRRAAIKDRLLAKHH